MDVEKARPVFVPRNPARAVLPFFPLTPPVALDKPNFYGELTLDTLMFIFYYQPGTPQQYYAARELKRQSWRFHREHQCWLQRVGEPKATAAEFETGTYRIFSPETWTSQSRNDLTIEYRWLDDLD